MDTIYVDLILAEAPSKPVRVAISRYMPLKAFLDLAENILSTDVYSLYINDKRLTDMTEIKEGDTIIALSTVSPNMTKYSFFKQPENFGSLNPDSIDSPSVTQVAVLGLQGAGKTSLILRFVYGFFKHNDTPTDMEAEYEKTLQVKGKDISMVVYDTPGEINCDTEALKRLSNIDAFLLSIGVDQLNNWPLIVKYHRLIKSYKSNPLILILITKIDLYDNKGHGDNLEIKAKLNVISNYAKNHQLLIFKTSAKTNKNINKVFSTIADRFVNPDKSAANIPKINEPELKYPFFFRICDKLLNYRLKCTKENC